MSGGGHRATTKISRDFKTGEMSILTVTKRAIKAHSPAHLALFPTDDFLAFDALRKASVDFVIEPPDLDPSCSTLSSWPSQLLVRITEIEEFTFVRLTGCEVVGLALEIYLYFVMLLL
jgi:hypothetical protein